MKMFIVVLSVLLLSGIAVAQKAPATKPVTPPATQIAKPEATKPVPQLTDEEKTQILFLQRNIAEATVNIATIQKQQSDFQNQLGALATQIQKRLGPNFTVNRDTLVVTEVPSAITPEKK